MCMAAATLTRFALSTHGDGQQVAAPRKECCGRAAVTELAVRRAARCVPKSRAHVACVAGATPSSSVFELPNPASGKECGSRVEVAAVADIAAGCAACCVPQYGGHFLSVTAVTPKNTVRSSPAFGQQGPGEGRAQPSDSATTRTGPWSTNGSASIDRCTAPDGCARNPPARPIETGLGSAQCG